MAQGYRLPENNYSQQAIDFMDKVLEISGLGDDTFLPDGESSAASSASLDTTTMAPVMGAEHSRASQHFPQSHCGSAACSQCHRKASKAPFEKPHDQDIVCLIRVKSSCLLHATIHSPSEVRVINALELIVLFCGGLPSAVCTLSAFEVF